MNLNTLLAIALGAGAMASAATTVQAQDLNGTLKKIKETNSITIGYRESSIPFLSLIHI